MRDRRKMMGEGVHVIDGIIIDSLEKFIEICQSGKAPKYYSWGDKIHVPYNGGKVLDFEIVGFDITTKKDGSVAKVTLMSSECPEETNVKSSPKWVSVCRYYVYPISLLRDAIESNIFNTLPDVLKNATETVFREYEGSRYNSSTNTNGSWDESADLNIWLPELFELQDDGQFGFNSAKRIRVARDTKQPVEWRTGSSDYLIAGSKNGNPEYTVTTSGLLKCDIYSNGFGTIEKAYSPVCICIG